ncbi:MAG: nitroreductase family protein [Ignavibacteria bacterium]|nr:nitroreductase family protein [Ignavibacteria bacterium]
MELWEAILTRRSIRKFKSQIIPEELIEKILRAGMQAPSARNKQPWHFVVIRNREMLNKISEVHPYAYMLKEAPLGILICGDTNIETTIEYIVQDCSAATQNMLLAAHGFGLGAVWLGIYPREQRITALKELLQIPNHIIPIAMIAVGYPDEIKSFEDRFNPERIHYEKW